MTPEQLREAIGFNRDRKYTVETWRQIQSIVGADVDGIPGKNTAEEIAAFQKRWGLQKAHRDGQAGRTLLLMCGLGRGLFKTADVAELDTEALTIGVDVSTYQHKPDWDRVVESGVRLVIPRVLEGDLDIDAQWNRNRLELSKLDIPWCGYCPVRMVGFPAKKVIEAMVKAGAAGSMGRLAIDLEYKRVEEADDKDPDLDARWTLKAVELATKATGKRPLVYLSVRSAKLLGRDCIQELAAKALLWWVDYSLQSKRTVPMMWGTEHWFLWQWCCVGHVSGVRRVRHTKQYNEVQRICVDLNLANHCNLVQL